MKLDKLRDWAASTNANQFGGAVYELTIAETANVSTK